VYVCASVALFVQHAMRMRHSLLSFVASLALPHFLSLSDKEQDFRNKILNKKCVLVFSKTFLVQRRI
jgi:hypothetical protein